MNNQLLRLSVLGVTLVGVFSSIHHLSRFGVSWLGYALVLVLAPYLLMQWLRRTGSTLAVVGYGLFSTLVIVWLGIVDGFLDHTLKAFNPNWGVHILPAFQGNLFYEATGVATFIASVFAILYGYRFFRSVLK